MRGFSATISSRSSLSPCCARASAEAFDIAIVSRNIPPCDAVMTSKPAVGGPSSTSCHSLGENAALVVMALSYADADHVRASRGSRQDTSPSASHTRTLCAWRDAASDFSRQRSCPAECGGNAVECAAAQSGGPGSDHQVKHESVLETGFEFGLKPYPPRARPGSGFLVRAWT